MENDDLSFGDLLFISLVSGVVTIGVVGGLLLVLEWWCCARRST